MAQLIDADEFVVATDADAVYVDWGHRHQRAIAHGQPRPAGRGCLSRRVDGPQGRGGLRLRADHQAAGQDRCLGRAACRAER